MIGNASLSHRLGGLYCLYCLDETQPFKPPFRIYLSLASAYISSHLTGELKKITNLVVEAKEKGINVVSALVKRMLEKNMFLFGSVDINEDSVTKTVNQLAELQNARIQVAYNKLFANTRMEHFLHMDWGMEVGLNVIQKMSKEYVEAKKLAIGEACKELVVEDLKPISEDNKMIGDTLEKIANDWNVQKDIFFINKQDSASDLLESNNHCCCYNKKRSNNNRKMMKTSIKNRNNYYPKCNDKGTCGSFMKGRMLMGALG
ncbi:hypothetical protein FCV25MIE_32035 [Fagus crenata]